jgi:hypothetical protein
MKDAYPRDTDIGLSKKSITNSAIGNSKVCST